ncbi:putative Zn-dependent aminopeptidase [Planctopirus limnophila DSM 3776]|uniref:Putative Zn-dependent aminopeptidase n=1 Tax=Planctopirus limnophila (strain ATCC 43296 / DSM 3776 / IFAM 1008 / Mu 290) TaxID=521674 RepID=D5SXP4_PLAL2|nr:M1 family metallopeptidase [Planctopirus limnophila]ADG67611.1 putative Zn-dependent aminopeptidase [Planctopirus limnophila DSM 3776]
MRPAETSIPSAMFIFPTRHVLHLTCAILLAVLPAGISSAAEDAPAPSNTSPIGVDPFQQIDSLLPTPTESRLASGAPGPAYWQQKASYKIDVTLDEDNRRLKGFERVHYENNSPHSLNYLWLQLQPDTYTPDSPATLTRTWSDNGSVSIGDLQRALIPETFEGGMNISGVKDATGKPLKTMIHQGLLKIELPAPLAPRSSFDFELAWEYAINDIKLLPGRTGYEMLDDGNAIYGLAYWYPRMCAYTDYGGWRTKQFIGRGEFTVEFGDYDVTIHVPADHALAATGELMNPEEALTPEQRERLKKSDTSDTPVFIVTKDEAEARRKVKTFPQQKAWRFKAENVRDFAFATSRTFVVDAWGVPLNGRTVRCMSLYPKEGMPLWDKYATHSVAQAIEVYSEVTGIPYPWPHCTAVMGIVSGGMEYPMINFNSPKPEKDGTYTETVKNRLISVIIHETGHNWFPMIINNDERHWMWLDEGFNQFVQGFAERAWKRRLGKSGEPSKITEYLVNPAHQPIMTQPDNLKDVGRNAYAKTSTGLTMLRETILGREVFDAAFKEYCRRWAFKRPEPADFFRTMEDASGFDLDWFWRGWFFSTSNNDVEVLAVTRRLLQTGDPAKDKERDDRKEAKLPPSLTEERDANLAKRVDKYDMLKDFYDTYDPHAVTEKKVDRYQKFMERLTPEEKATLANHQLLYEVRIRNNGELPMPLILQLEFDDGSKEIHRYPAEIWRLDGSEFSKLLITAKPLRSVMADPYNETADINYSNNRFPRTIAETDLTITKPTSGEPRTPRPGTPSTPASAAPSSDASNPMREHQEELRRKEQAAKKAEKKPDSAEPKPEPK